MKNKPDLRHVMFIFGIIALIVGAFDPLEGAIVIVIGIISLTWSAYLNHDRHWRVFLAACAMIIVGVIFLFYLSSLGGFGGNSGLSWWWGILILPYPIGWIIAITTLTIRAIKTIKRIKQNI
ncbi:MAG: hypothetical protein QM800_15015 [Paludibacter sp.]